MISGHSLGDNFLGSFSAGTLISCFVCGGQFGGKTDGDDAKPFAKKERILSSSDAMFSGMVH